MDVTETREAKRPLQEGILPLPKEGLADHHRSKIFVEVPGGSGPIRKEIGSSPRRRLGLSSRVCEYAW
jgi:hypothetical protein